MVFPVNYDDVGTQNVDLEALQACTPDAICLPFTIPSDAQQPGMAVAAHGPSALLVLFVIPGDYRDLIWMNGF
jgi:hypothetical protein